MIKIVKLNNFTVRVSNLDIVQQQLIRDKLTYKTRTVENDHYKYHKVIWNINQDGSIDIPIALMPFICKYISLPVNFFNPNKIFEISDEEAEFLETKFEENMLDIYNAILNGPPRSLIQLPTGTGKTFILAALVKSYIGTGNILVMSPSSMVRKEISSRCNVPVGLDLNSHVGIVDYAGFGRSYKIDTPEVIQWLNNVEVLLYDESEALTENTEYTIQHCINAKVFFGFSANPDSIQNKPLLDIHNLNGVLDTAMNIIKYFGLASVYKDNRKTINLNIIKGSLQRPYALKMQGAQALMVSYNMYLKEPVLYRGIQFMLNSIKARKTSGILFSMVHTKHAMEAIGNYLKDEGYSYVLWDSSSITYVDWDGNETVLKTEKIKNENGFEMFITDYAKLKDICSQNKVDVILATTVAKRGINILQISDVFLIRDNKYGNINQIIGRVRNIVPNVWCMKYEGKGITAVTSGSRINTIRRSYDCNISYYSV